MTLFVVLVLVILVAAIIAAGGFLAPRARRTRVVERDVRRPVYDERPVAEPVDEVVEEPLASRRVVRRRWR